MIDTDKKQISSDLLYSQLTYKVRGALFAVFNELGFGHKEQIYQHALKKELASKKIPYKQEVYLPIKYRGENVGNYRPDLVIDEKIIVELKSVEFMPLTYETQLLQYLKLTDFKLGLLVNFDRPKLFIKRIIWTLIDTS